MPSIQASDKITTYTLATCATIAGSILFLIIGFLINESGPILLKETTSFITSGNWHPTESKYGLAAMLVGSLSSALLAVIIAAPTGVIIAIWGQYFAPPSLAKMYRIIIELLAGIPSVVYGFWGLIFLVPLIGKFVPPGASLIAGALVLALMILPLTALATDAAFKHVPRKHLQAAASLGLPKHSTIRRICLPQALPGIVSGIILQMGRALGETMAVLMVCGNVVQFPDSLFAPVRTLTANIALEMAYAVDEHQSALFVSGLLLLLVTMLLVFLAQRVGYASE